MHVASYLSSQPLLRALLCTPEEVPRAPLPSLLLRTLREEEITMDFLAELTQKKMSYEIDTVLGSQVEKALTG